MLTTFFNNAGKFHNFGTNTSTEFGEIHGILYNLFHNMFEFIIHITCAPTYNFKFLSHIKFPDK